MDTQSAQRSAALLDPYLVAISDPYGGGPSAEAVAEACSPAAIFDPYGGSSELPCIASVPGSSLAAADSDTSSRCNSAIAGTGGAFGGTAVHSALLVGRTPDQNSQQPQQKAKKAPATAAVVPTYGGSAAIASAVPTNGGSAADVAAAVQEAILRASNALKNRPGERRSTTVAKATTIAATTPKTRKATKPVMTPTLNAAHVPEPAKINGSKSPEPVKKSAARHSKLPEPAEIKGSESPEPVKQSAAQHSKLPAFMQLILDEKGYKPPVMLQDVGLMLTSPAAADSRSERVVPAGQDAAGFGSPPNSEMVTPHAPILQATKTGATAQAAKANGDSQPIPNGDDSSTKLPPAVVELDLDIANSDDEDLADLGDFGPQQSNGTEHKQGELSQMVLETGSNKLDAMPTPNRVPVQSSGAHVGTENKLANRHLACSERVTVDLSQDDDVIVEVSVAAPEPVAVPQLDDADGDSSTGLDDEPTWLEVPGPDDAALVSASEICAACLDDASDRHDAQEQAFPQYVPFLARYLTKRPEAFVTRGRRFMGKGKDTRYFADKRSEDVMADKVLSGCWVCGKLDHDSSKCSFKRCFKCSQQGHEATECPGWEVVCDVCRRPGHAQEDCPETIYNLALGHEVDIFFCRCADCLEQGHLKCSRVPAVASKAFANRLRQQKGMTRRSSDLLPTAFEERPHLKPWRPKVWSPPMPSKPQSWWQGSSHETWNAHFPYGVVPGAVAATFMAQAPRKRWLTEQVEVSPFEGEIDEDEDGDMDNGGGMDNDASMLLQDVHIISEDGNPTRKKQRGGRKLKRRRHASW